MTDKIPENNFFHQYKPMPKEIHIPVNLRDYFAAAAFQLMGDTLLVDEVIERTAVLSYKIADAMLKARQEGGAA